MKIVIEFSQSIFALIDAQHLDFISSAKSVHHSKQSFKTRRPHKSYSPSLTAVTPALQTREFTSRILLCSLERDAARDELGANMSGHVTTKFEAPTIGQ